MTTNVVFFPNTATPQLVALMMSVSKKTRATLKIQLAEIGLAIGEEDILVVLDDGTPVCVAELSRKLGVRPSTMQRPVDRLLARGHLEYTVNPMLRLTESGMAMALKVVSVRTRIANDLQVILGPEAIGELCVGLRRLDEALGRGLAPQAEIPRSF